MFEKKKSCGMEIEFNKDCEEVSIPQSYHE